MAGLELPMALVDFWMLGQPSVNPDNVQGGFLATRHLLDIGRKRIACIAGSLAHFSIRERNHGYRRALYEAGVLADPDLEVVAPPGVEPDLGAAQAMLSRCACASRPTRCSPATTWWRWPRCRSATRPACACRRTSPSSASTTSAAAAGASLAPVDAARRQGSAGRAGVELLMRGHEMPQQMVLPVELVVRGSSAS